jgi:hypothetical protein
VRKKKLTSFRRRTCERPPLFYFCDLADAAAPIYKMSRHRELGFTVDPS